MVEEREKRPWWRTPSGIALGGFLAIAGFFLVTEHTAHVFGVLPYLLLLACPLLHLLLHRGRHGRGQHAEHDDLRDGAGADRGTGGRP